MDLIARTDPRYNPVLAEQEQRWPFCIKLGKEGNPFATLCRHCYGRHKPPNDELCPHDPPPK